MQGPGIFAVCVTLLVSGCATGPVHQSMAVEDLNYFKIDCSKKKEQIEFLQRQLNNGDDMLIARLKNMVTPWTALTDPEGRSEQYSIGSGHSNWLIKQTIWKIRYTCS